MQKVFQIGKFLTISKKISFINSKGRYYFVQPKDFFFFFQSRVSINKPTDRNKTNGSDPPLQIHDSTDKKSFQFQPKCHITVKDSLSAISRAKTELCKQEIADVSCLSLEGKLFPKDIQNYCPFKGKELVG